MPQNLKFNIIRPTSNEVGLMMTWL